MAEDYTTREAADKLGITPDALRMRVMRGKLIGKKRGKMWFFDKKNMLRILREKHQGKNPLGL